MADSLDAVDGITVDSITRTDDRSYILFGYATTAGALLEIVTDIIWKSFRQ